MRRNSQELAAQGPPVDLDRHALGEVALGHRADDPGDFSGRLDHVLDQLVDRADRRFPAAAGVLDPPALADLPFLADDLGEALEFLGHLLVERDDLVEQAGDFAIGSVDLLGEAHGEVASTKRTQGADELTAINEVARGLNVHSTLRVAYSPTPVGPVQPPGCESPPYQTNWFPLP